MSWEIIIDEPLSGQANMQRDQELFDLVEMTGNGHYLRFYSWRESTYTYGYRQDPDFLNFPRKKYPRVARMTGGGVVLHEPGELTYCLVCPKSLFPENIMAACLKISEKFLPALRKIGIEAEIAGRKGTTVCDDADCFGRPASYEILAQGQKIIGSAQKRGRVALMQHGTFQLPIEYEYRELAKLIAQEFI